MRFLSRITRTLFILAAAAWFGGIIMLTVALPMLFDWQDHGLSRTVGAKLAGAILLRWDRVALGLLTGLVLTGIGGVWMMPKPRRVSVALPPLLVLLVLSQLAGSFAVLPRMERLQSQITSFEVDAPRTPERKAFGQWHGISQALMLVNLACLGALLAVQAGAGHRLEGRRPEDYA